MVIGHSGAPVLFTRWIYLFHMPIFFIISGYLFKIEYFGTPCIFIKKKLKGLYIPYLKWGIVFMIFHNLLFKINIYEAPIDNFYCQIFRLLSFRGADQLLGGYWFLQSLFISFLFFFIFNIVLMKKCNNVRRNTCISILFFLSASMTITIFEKKYPIIDSCNLLAAFYLSLGFFLKQCNIEAFCVKRLSAIALMSFLPTLVMASINTETFNMAYLSSKSIFPFVLSSLLGFIFIYSITGLKLFQSNILLDLLGNNTLVILTFHMLSFKILSFFILYFSSGDINHLQDFPVLKDSENYYWVLYTIVGIIVPLLLEYLFKIHSKIKIKL